MTWHHRHHRGASQLQSPESGRVRVAYQWKLLMTTLERKGPGWGRGKRHGRMAGRRCLYSPGRLFIVLRQTSLLSPIPGPRPRSRATKLKLFQLEWIANEKESSANNGAIKTSCEKRVKPWALALEGGRGIHLKETRKKRLASLILIAVLPVA